MYNNSTKMNDKSQSTFYLIKWCLIPRIKLMYNNSTKIIDKNTQHFT